MYIKTSSAQSGEKTSSRERDCSVLTECVAAVIIVGTLLYGLMLLAVPIVLVVWLVIEAARGTVELVGLL